MRQIGKVCREPANARRAFEVYWGSDRSVETAAAVLGVRPGIIRQWAEKYGWQERADERDRIVEERRERRAVEAMARMYEKHVEAGRLLRERGISALKRIRLDNVLPRDTVAMIKTGVDIERQAAGLPQELLAIQAGDERAIEAAYMALEARRRAALEEAEGEEVEEGEVLMIEGPAGR